MFLKVFIYDANLLFKSFSLILFIEKVSFDSKVLAPYDIKKDDKDQTLSPQREDKTGRVSFPEDKSLKSPLKEKNLSDNDQSDEEEDVFKNILSTKGKMASFLHQRNMSKSGNTLNIIHFP